MEDLDDLDENDKFSYTSLCPPRSVRICVGDQSRHINTDLNILYSICIVCNSKKEKKYQKLDV